MRIGKQCESPKCRGDKLNCTIEMGHADTFGDTIRVLNAWDDVDPDGNDVRVPATGNLPIVSVSGNTTCVPGGSLPCLICPGGATCGGGKPISAEPGEVTFKQDQYVIQPTDPAFLESQANVRVQDLCDGPGSEGCSNLFNLVQFTAASELIPCCGNNYHEPKGGETCDGTDAEVCNGPCRAPGGQDACTCCGDGVTQTGEDCDDGNMSDGDGCNTGCVYVCGDNSINRTVETCDGSAAGICNSPCRAAGGADECTCCGDGIVQAGEDCDDGNMVSGDGCNTTCLFECGDNDVNRPAETCDGTDAAVCNSACRGLGEENECTCCGDGLVQPGEDCDDGNMADGDGCNTTCLYTCGDNDINLPAETCDGADAGVCNSACRAPGNADPCTCCGDGIVQAGEDCDDGNMVNGDGCNTSCLYVCGDNDVNTPAETCDGTDSAACNSSCRTPGAADQCTCCGDGLIQAGEDCDDGNMVSGDGCNTSCRFECGDNDVNTPAETCDGTDSAACNSSCRPPGAADQCTCCGDGLIQAGEDCDDGNMVSGDGCNTSCRFECGDNDVNTPAETCDGTDSAACNSSCRPPGAANPCTCCGDGLIQAGEECDDGNVVNGDGCNTTCLFTCGDNDVNQSSETCDGTDALVCNSPCRASGETDQCTCCGDGLVQPGEDCDDGNMISGDGCNTSCLLECGDNDVNQSSETCDGIDSAVCNSSCRAPGSADQCTCCGDGLMQAGEDCDDGNMANGDGCNTTCLFTCGDNDVNQSSETCDGTDALVCNGACRAPGETDECTCCGDGVVQPGEDCDDGNVVHGDGCNPGCLFECGDNSTNTPAETCDGTDDAVCNLDCRPTGSGGACTCCGDGVVQSGEDCDDGNMISGDGCNTRCLFECGDNDVNTQAETCDGTDATVCNLPCRTAGGADQCTCCGDGIVQTGEDCDDGNEIGGDGCDSSCLFLCGDNDINQTVETCDGTDAAGCHRPCRTPGDKDECTCCGDGIVNGNEDCDDGNLNNTDGCNSKCFFACGDGAVNLPQETCDSEDDSVCNGACRDAGSLGECTCCGDGLIQPGEECDDGNKINGDGCNTSCLFDCGDNDVNTPEETCDGTDRIGCHRACRAPGLPAQCTCCGDGIVNGDEDCDDGNTDNHDGCNMKCFFACGDGVVNRPDETCDGDDAGACLGPCRAAGGIDECTCCGDGILQGDEQCDDGNDIPDDGCTDCRGDAVCGNHVVDQAAETCDGSDDVGCHRACRRPDTPDECTCCGDGVVNGDENCDDGNDVNTDGCDNKCFFKCGDGAINQPNETCDLADAAVCNTPCRAPGDAFACTCCGDGEVQDGEGCDDGNAESGDGCSAECTIELGFAGCTAAFWTQSQHAKYWPVQYGPGDTVDAIFGVNSTGNPTLLKALSIGGTGEAALLRNAVAGLLNSVHPQVSYVFDSTQVIAFVQQAYIAGSFDDHAAVLQDLNEMGCTIDKSNRIRDGLRRGASQTDKDGR